MSRLTDGADGWLVARSGDRFLLEVLDQIDLVSDQKGHDPFDLVEAVLELRLPIVIEVEALKCSEQKLHNRWRGSRIRR